MNLTYQAAEGQPAWRIDAGALNNELAAALGGWCNGWSASHNASQAIVTLSPEREGDAALVQQVVEAHVANTDKREWNKGIEAQITALEATVTQRMLRDAALGNPTRVQQIEDQIAVLRATRK